MALDPDDPLTTLTARQRTVADLLLSGKTNAQIGAALGLALSTVKNHTTAIYAKLDIDAGGGRHAKGRVGLAVRAARALRRAERDAGYAAGYRHGYVDGLAAGRAGDRRTAPALGNRRSTRARGG